MQTDDAVAAQGVPEQAGIVGAALSVMVAFENLLHLGAQPVRLIVQALGQQDHLDEIFGARGDEVGLALQHLANDELQNHRLNLSDRCATIPA